MPFLGGVSALSLAVAPFALAFAISWGVYRNNSFAWIGQDVLVRTPNTRVLKPTLKFCSVDLRHVVTFVVSLYPTVIVAVIVPAYQVVVFWLRHCKILNLKFSLTTRSWHFAGNFIDFECSPGCSAT